MTAVALPDRGFAAGSPTPLAAKEISTVIAYYYNEPAIPEVGYSVLIWNLDQSNLTAALWGPPLELYAAPADELPAAI